MRAKSTAIRQCFCDFSYSVTVIVITLATQMKVKFLEEYNKLVKRPDDQVFDQVPWSSWVY